eukprot:816744-Rhodomonas_salina.2
MTCTPSGGTGIVSSALAIPENSTRVRAGSSVALEPHREGSNSASMGRAAGGTWPEPLLEEEEEEVWLGGEEKMGVNMRFGRMTVIQKQ